MKKLFLALWPDDKTRHACYRVIEFEEKLAGKRVMVGNLHVTLVFIGQVNTDCEKNIMAACDDVRAEPFSIKFDSLSYWQKPKILYLTSQQIPPVLIQLAQELKQLVKDCGVQTDDREYCPHVTLLRKVNKQLDLSFESIAWHANAFCLAESVTTQNGPVYKVIDSWAFS